MRIACLHVPQFALQCLTRVDPSLRGAAVAVVSAPIANVASGSSGRAGESGSMPIGPALGARALYAPVVQACSRAAWALGIRLGMTATAAHACAPGQLRIVNADSALERETVRALADALLGVSSIVDVGGRVGAGGAHLALYCEVPSKTRGTSYGDRLLEVVDTLGLTGRIGIADDRFTAWVAAAHGGLPSDEQGVVSVPRGGSAAFLSPMPLSLLAITPEVQHMLEALGVRTLGEFAALPAPSVSRSPSALEADYQALARGDSGTGLRPYTPEAPIREEAVLSAASSGGAAIAMLADRIALRLRGRARGAARLEVAVTGTSDAPPASASAANANAPTAALADGSGPIGTGASKVIPITPAMAPLSTLATAPAGMLPLLESAESLAEALGKALGDDLHTASRIKVAVTAEAVSGDAAADADHAAPPPAPIDVLGVVLATTGSLGTWQLTSPTSGSASALRSERRDAHRRTRASRAGRARSRVDLVQPRLFSDRK